MSRFRNFPNVDRKEARLYNERLPIDIVFSRAFVLGRGEESAPLMSLEQMEQMEQMEQVKQVKEVEQMKEVEEVVGDLLRRHGHTLALAESCTGGLIASRITDIAGSSEYFIEGVVVYSNQAKMDLLGVSAETLVDFGAVSEQTVREMCAGIRRLSRANLTLAISGIAGPGGGSAEKPVGLVYIGLYDGNKFFIKEFRFQGSRKEIKLQASQMALDLIRRYYVRSHV